MTKVAIIQSNYIPWKGYFDLIQEVDVFVFLDDVQMTKRDWRTRNKIKTPNGTEWLSVPVRGGQNQLIYETEIVQNKWQRRHRRTLQRNYAKAPYFKSNKYLLDWLYLERHTNLSAFNQQTTKMLCDILGIDTMLLCATELDVDGAKDDRLIKICQELEATVYLSGPSARSYIRECKFEKAGIGLEFKEYSGYPRHPQLFPPFEHEVSILDLIFNCGPQAANYIWGWRTDNGDMESEWKVCNSELDWKMPWEVSVAERNVVARTPEAERHEVDTSPHA